MNDAFDSLCVWEHLSNDCMMFTCSTIYLFDINGSSFYVLCSPDSESLRYIFIRFALNCSTMVPRPYMFGCSMSTQRGKISSVSCSNSTGIKIPLGRAEILGALNDGLGLRGLLVRWNYRLARV
jgi:hypothetical protein